VLTNKQTNWQRNKQTPQKTSTSLRYASPVGKYVLHWRRRTGIYKGSATFLLFKTMQLVDDENIRPRAGFPWLESLQCFDFLSML